MNPVIGLDISKGKSDGQVFLDKGQPYGPPFCFHHNQEGLMQLLDIIADVQDKTEKPPTVILESTGHYHQAVIQFLEEHGILFLVVNPLISHQAKKSSLRKVKTDAVDAYRLCELYYKEEFEDHKQRGVQLLNLRHLTRQFLCRLSTMSPHLCVSSQGRYAGLFRFVRQCGRARKIMFKSQSF